jgi:hypothetical protein
MTVPVSKPIGIAPTDRDGFDYSDKNVPCTRPYVAQWIFGDFNPAGPRHIYGWVARRTDTGESRTCA